MNALPVMMVKNEELFIQKVLEPLARTFGKVLLGDTGSEDRTVPIASGIEGVEIYQFGPQTPAGLCNVRATLSQMVMVEGYPWEFMVDGDELYNLDTLKFLKSLEVPEGKFGGFTTMVTIDPEGEDFWELDDKFNRLCFLPAGVTWTGDYPFEIPETFAHPEQFWYASLPDGYPVHALHLHRLVRSPLDRSVAYRQEKQYQFAMQDIAVPRTVLLEARRWNLGHP